MQKLYSITVFLNKETLKILDEKYYKIQEQINYSIVNGSDKTGKRLIIRELYISGISLVFMEANYHHKKQNYEIGFTYESLEEWIQFEKRIKELNKNHSKGEYDNIKYAIISEENIHTPFYFVFDKRCSKNNSFSINAEIGEKEYYFYNNELSNFIDQEYSKNMNFQMNKDNLLRIKKIEIPIDEDSISKIKYENNDLLMEITNNVFSLNIK